MKRWNQDRGFSLVELMIVVFILGILISIAVPVYTSATEGALMRSCQANQRTIVGSATMAEALGEDLTGVGTTNEPLDTGSGWGSILIPNYISAVPHCPSETGGLYNLSPEGFVVSDLGAGQTTFVNEGQANSHRLLP